MYPVPHHVQPGGVDVHIDEEGLPYVYTHTRDLTFETLLRDIEHELHDQEFEARAHGRNDTYRDGCRGPLCKYRERTRKREFRTRAARQVLPVGVQPETRPRGEQQWDKVMAAILTQLESIRKRQAETQGGVLAKLSVDSMKRYLHLAQNSDLPVLTPARIPHQEKRPRPSPKLCAPVAGSLSSPKST